jgi:hypothetical protein
MASKDSNEDESKDKRDSSEDSFGLPDVEYKPLDRQSDSQAQGSAGYSGDSPASDSSYDSAGAEEPKSRAPVILGIVIALVVVIAGYLIYNFVYKPKAEAERIKKEQLAKEALLKKQRDEEARLAKQRQEEEEKRRLAELAKTPPVGTIETLTGRTKRYYVVVTSDIDDDLLMDYARKLSAKGVSTKIIPPYGAKKFYRLAIADHDSFASAQTNADAAKADYGAGVWVIKY